MKRMTCLSLALIPVVTLVTAGCYSAPLPVKPPEVIRTDTNPEFAGLREDLVDIVVLSARPPEGNPSSDGPHLRRFRRLVYEGLINKGYSPLELTYVDKTVATEPRAKRSDPDHNRTRFGEDAIMVLSLNEWDKRYVSKEGGIMVSATLSLIKSKPKSKLWMHEIRHRFYKIPRTAADISLTIDEVVVDEVVEDLLKKLPPRA